MRTQSRIFTCIFSAFPSILFGICVLTSFIEEYFWLTYAFMAVIFFGASSFLGLILPSILREGRFNYPWLQIFISSSLAWLVALIGFGIINLTPLCIGQDNGDGNNGFSLCFLYTLLAALMYSPALFPLLLINAAISGNIFTRLTKPGIERDSENTFSGKNKN